MIALTLPYPPSANHLYTVARGRKILSAAGRQYQESVALLVKASGNPKAPAGRLAVTLDVSPPDRRRRDLANCEKVLVDSLKLAGVIEDDCLIDRLVLNRRDVVRHGSVDVSIDALSAGLTDREAMLAALDAEHWHTLAALADLCEESGLAAEAAGWRWLCRNRKWPTCQPIYGGWDWESLPDGMPPGGGHAESCELPDAVTTLIEEWSVWGKEKPLPAYRTSESAALAAAAVAVGSWLAERAG